MKSTSVTLGSHFEDVIRQAVASGEYVDASEVIREALKLFEMRQRASTELTHLLQEAEDSGIADDFNPETFFEETLAKRKNG